MKTSIMLADVVMLAGGTTEGATLGGSVHTADGDPIAARITILRGPPNPGDRDAPHGPRRQFLRRGVLHGHPSRVRVC